MANREEHPLKKGNTLSLGQQANFHAAVLKALPRDIDPELARNWERNGKALAEVLREALLPPINAEQSGNTTHLRLLESVVLDSTCGTTIFADTDFELSDNPRYPRLQDMKVFSDDTLETTVDVYKLKKSGSFWSFFNSIGDPNLLCFTQGQIVEFCNAYRHLLAQDGFCTFFLLKVYDELFVVDVMEGNSIYVSANRFNSVDFWNAKQPHRLVVPQRARNL